MSPYNLEDLAAAGLRSARENWWVVADVADIPVLAALTVDQIHREFPPAQKPDLKSTEGVRKEVARLLSGLPAADVRSIVKGLAEGLVRRQAIDERLQKKLHGK